MFNYKGIRVGTRKTTRCFETRKKSGGDISKLVNWDVSKLVKKVGPGSGPCCRRPLLTGQRWCALRPSPVPRPPSPVRYAATPCSFRSSLRIRGPTPARADPCPAQPAGRLAVLAVLPSPGDVPYRRDVLFFDLTPCYPGRPSRRLGNAEASGKSAQRPLRATRAYLHSSRHLPCTRIGGTPFLARPTRTRRMAQRAAAADGFSSRFGLFFFASPVIPARIPPRTAPSSFLPGGARITCLEWDWTDVGRGGAGRCGCKHGLSGAALGAPRRL